MNRYETEIEADAKVPLIRITRIFDAPPNKVFRAHVDPALIVQWLGPRGGVTQVDTWDCRSGGSYRYVQDFDGQLCAFRGCFHELRPGALIVQTFTFEGYPDGVALERLVFEDLGDGRTRLVCSSLVDSFEGRDAFMQGGMEVGVREGYERLDALLEP